MTWTAPMTAVASSVFSANQFNTHIRDNLSETAVAQAFTAGDHFVVTGTNSIVPRTITGASVATTETSTTASYTDLATGGPAVSVDCGAKALVLWESLISYTGTDFAAVSYAVSGSTSIAASHSRAIMRDGRTSGFPIMIGGSHLETALTPGTNTFTLKYWSNGSTATFQHRYITVIPF